MAMDTTKIKLPAEVTRAIINKVGNTSTIAALSPSTPQLFLNEDYMVFNGAAEAEVVAEGQKKSSYEQEASYITGKKFKVQCTTRVTEELKWADEDNRLEIISSIQEDQTKAIARALDYVIYHAINPKSGTNLSGYDALTAKAASVTDSGDDIANVDALADAVNEYEINGVALSRTWASRLRKLRVPATGMRFYPEIPINLAAGTLDGIPAATSTTVDGKKATTPTKVLGIMGDYSLIKWGMIRDIWAEVIQYGDPDQTGVDLKAHNQIAYRTEAMFSYAVLDPKAFAVLKAE
ncbi:phage major capsid family protein [Bifidobacterium pseudolongum]|uniref:Head protein n=1 Tax=Bifidobacterium pseudolongum subsp. globosum TaxID=1690 RepID=A0A2N3QTN3_9BIFI|nr:phage major capsid protein [Bifidobacterium pseudolongum]PKU95375.1 head protein [Bifidobacterium pseudolongum subsp. globosum]PKV00158.1 head protein [Bifidobacterium pseudolongum subsp. globosum]